VAPPLPAAEPGASSNGVMWVFRVERSSREQTVTCLVELIDDQ